MSLVCASDFSRAAHTAAEVAASIALRFDETVFLAHVIEPADLPETFILEGEPGLSRDIEAAERALEREAARLRGITDRIVTRVAIGSPEAALALLGSDESARLLVCGPPPVHPFAGRIARGTVSHLLRVAGAPLLVARGASAGFQGWAHHERALRILVAIDLDESLAAGLAFAEMLQEAGDCDLEYVHVDSRDEAKEHALSRLTRGAPVHHRAGSPAAAIAELGVTAHFDLIVTGTHARQGTGRLFHPSVAERILAHAALSVAIAPIGSVLHLPGSAEHRE